MFFRVFDFAEAAVEERFAALGVEAVCRAAAGTAKRNTKISAAAPRSLPQMEFSTFVDTRRLSVRFQALLTPAWAL